MRIEMNCGRAQPEGKTKVYDMALINFHYQHGANSEANSVQTPRDLYDQLNEEFHFDFDPCPIGYYVPGSSVPDGLTCEWGRRNWVNPPFNEIGKWFLKAVEESRKGKLTVMLCPFRPSQKYWYENIHPHGPEYRVIKGKVKFPGFKQGFPQAMVIMVVRPK